MRINRRNFTKQTGTAAIGLVLTGCSTDSSPTAPTASTPPQRRAEIVAATGKYAVEFRANVKFNSVVEAAQTAGLTLVVVDKTDWRTQSGTYFAGALVESVSGPGRGKWLIDINGKLFCNDARKQSVAAGDRISFYGNGPTVMGTCS